MSITVPKSIQTNTALSKNGDVIKAVEQFKSALSETLDPGTAKRFDLSPEVQAFLKWSQGVGSLDDLKDRFIKIGKIMNIQRILLYQIESGEARILMNFTDPDDDENVGDVFSITTNPNIQAAVETNTVSQIPVPGIGIDAAFPAGKNNIIIGVDNTDAARTFTETELLMLKFVASSITSAYDAGLAISRLGIDALTGLSNRRAFDSAIDEDVDVFWEAIEPIETLSFLDIDFFKRVNDTHGHEAGDTVLRHIAGILKQEVTKLWGIVYRYGWEEFVATFPSSISYEQLDTIREAVKSNPSKYNDTVIEHTISIGFARREELIPLPELRPGFQDAQRMVRIADKAVYQAKALKRDITVKELLKTIEL